MNIFEISDKAGISVKKLRVLDKLGVLRHDASTTDLDEIRATLKVGNRLNVAQLVRLIENPGGLLELGKYAPKASTQLDELGSATDEVAPREISALILDAFEKQPEAVASVVEWCKGIIPAHDVGHAYIGTRLLLGVPKDSRKHEAPRLQRVMMNCRDHPDFAGWWRQEKTVSSRNRTVYRKSELDL